MYLDQSMKIFPTHQACKLRARIFARLKDPEVSGKFYSLFSSMLYYSCVILY
jgi:hypothetical protein